MSRSLTHWPRMGPTPGQWDMFSWESNQQLSHRKETNLSVWSQLHLWPIIKNLPCLLSAPWVAGSSSHAMLHALVLPNAADTPSGWETSSAGVFIHPVSRRNARLSEDVCFETYIGRQFPRKCVSLRGNIWITFALLDMWGRFPTLSSSICLAGSASHSPVLCTQGPGFCLTSFSSFPAPSFPRTRHPNLPGGRGCWAR